MSAVLQEPRPTIRPMLPVDLDAVMRVEKAAYSHPWSESILRDCLRVGYVCCVCQHDDAIVGHAVMSVAVGEAHLLNICVSPDLHGRGLGRRLLRRMLRVAGEHAVDTVFLEVRASNAAAAYLYESEGFCEVGRRRGYYPTDAGREDAVVYARAML